MRSVFGVCTNGDHHLFMNVAPESSENVGQKYSLHVAEGANTAADDDEKLAI